MPETIELELLLPDVLALRVVLPPDVLPADIAAVIAGKPGPPGGSTYVHTQTVAAAVWTVAHNLGRRPSVAVTDHLGNLVLADVRYLDDDLVQVAHSTAITGFAYCN
ncbi:hypothetical protein [Acidovorax sp. Leaf78]|uniref:hypothetical protein n=1 Tax=Acidovorax sp. Leaf78 TaxID=1736237 RepID=UPI0006F89066|nr:hypothetical protein [Acidovorax sp. Leaf78]KQO23501.1 hypothetical protein ASF16_04885 [Acidovorax sp. Leaf78]